MTKARREYYSKRLTQKYQELDAVESQLQGELGKVEELKLNNQAERILSDIEELEKKLSELDAKDANSNVRYLNLEKSFQKIDFSKAKKVAQSINNKFGDASGAVLLFLQRSTKQKGDFCIREVLDLIISDRKVGGEIIGDFRPYSIDLGSPISEFNETEFSRRLASYLSDNSEENLQNTIKVLCDSLRGGSTIFIRVENWDSVTEPESFLNWFMENFWNALVDELKPVFTTHGKIRVVVALIAKSIIFPNSSCLPYYFCTEDMFEPGKIVELPLPNWTSNDIKNWLINFRGLSIVESKQLAGRIYRESEGTPDTICSILEREFRVW